MPGSAWLKLSGGRSNYTWKLSHADAADTYVVKLYRGPARNPLFPNQPDKEAQLLLALADQGFAPHLAESFNSTLGPCNIYAHLPGNPWQEDCARVGALMRKLHGISPPGGLRPAPDGSAALAEQTRGILERCQDNAALARLGPLGNVPPSNRTCLLHGDIVPGNLILNHTGLHLIDWQCPAVGDPCEDIAIFLSPAMQRLYRGLPLAKEEGAEVFHSYGSDKVMARYQALAPWYHWRMASYCQWQVENGQPDYAEGRDLEVEALQRSLR